MRGLGFVFCNAFLHNEHMNILQEIFSDHFEEIKYTLHPRATEIENIEKMINCVVIPASAQLAAIYMPENVLRLWPEN